LNAEDKSTLRYFVLEVIIYAGLVAVYFYLALVFLGKWLYQLFIDNRKYYAIAALALIIGQGIVLELVTSSLLKFIKTRLAPTEHR
jgi:NADH:ubiquinone oxidoreductase subunit 6 (subunit J)